MNEERARASNSNSDSDASQEQASPQVDSRATDERPGASAKPPMYVTSDGLWEYEGSGWHETQRARTSAEIADLSRAYETYAVEQAMEHGRLLMLPELPEAPELLPDLQREDLIVGGRDSAGYAVGCGVFLVAAPLAFVVGWVAVNWGVGLVAGFGVASLGLLILAISDKLTVRRETKTRHELEAKKSPEDRQRDASAREEHSKAVSNWAAAAAERRRINEAVLRAAEEGKPHRVARDQAPRQSFGAGDQRLVEALASIPGMTRNQQQWLHYNDERTQAVGRAIRDTEGILAVAIGENAYGAHVEVVVVTDSRVIFLREKKTTPWYSLTQVGHARSQWSIHGQHLDVQTPNGHERLWQVRPPQAAAAIAGFLASGGTRPLAMVNGASGETAGGSPLVMGASAAGHSHAKFLGGQFVGNEARKRSALHLPLRDGTTVDITLTSSDQIGITHLGELLGTYDLRDQHVMVDEATKLGRGIRRGRLAATGVATLLLGPIGLVGVPFSTAQRVRSAFAIAIEDGEDFGAFAVSDSAFGQRVGMRKRALETGSSQPVEPEPSSGIIEQLERLAALRDSQAITDAEYQELKTSMLGRSPGGESGERGSSLA